MEPANVVLVRLAKKREGTSSCFFMHGSLTVVKYYATFEAQAKLQGEKMETLEKPKKETIEDLLRVLSNAHGISGREGNIREIVKEKLKEFVDETREDTMGNLIAIKYGEKGWGSPVIMIAAHMDEIGLVVKYIDEKGFAHFGPSGGWFDQVLVGQRVVLRAEKGQIYGVLGCKPPHTMKEEEKNKPIKIDQMFIDIGATSEKDAEKLGVKAGTPVTMDREMVKLANDRITGKTFDNRAGCAVLIKALQELKEQTLNVTVCGVFTVQEEVGLKGARTSPFSIEKIGGAKPTVAIATDVTLTGDHPGTSKNDSTVELGKGPVITIRDADGRGIIVPEKVLKWLRETVEEYNIPSQEEVSSGGTTDATAIHLMEDGIPTGVISIADRYVHTPIETISLNDLENMEKLIRYAIINVAKYFS